jgi:hypothetical protein
MTNKLKTASRFAFMFATVAMAGVPVAQAETSWGSLVKQTMEQYTTGKASKGSAIEPRASNDTWGDSPVVRDTLRKSTPVAKEQLTDERFRDERQGRQLAAEPRVKSKEVVRPAEPTREVAAVRVTPAHRASAVHDAPQSVQASAPVSSAAVCTNVARAWEGAAALASRGEEERAYGAYLRLLSSCNAESELKGTVFQLSRNLSGGYLERLRDEPVMASPKLLDAYASLTLYQMYAANKAKDAPRALALSREIREYVLASSDLGALEVSGWLEQRANSPKAAEKLFRAALKINRELDTSREGLIYALLSQGKVEVASAEYQKLDARTSDELAAQLSLAQARQALAAGDMAGAQRRFAAAEKQGIELTSDVVATKAWLLKGSDPAKAAGLFRTLLADSPENVEYQTGLVESLAQAKDYAQLAQFKDAPGSAGDRVRSVLATQLETRGRRSEAAQLRGETPEGQGGQVSLALGTRTKSGNEGKRQLSQVVAPELAARVALGDNARLEVEAASLRMDNGLQSVRGREARMRVTLRGNDVEATLGLGGSQVEGASRLTFDSNLRFYGDKGHFEVGGSRTPVTDSVKSYAGTYSSEGKLEGRAMRTELRLGGEALQDSGLRLGWEAGAGSVEGENIAGNNFLRGRASLTQDITKEGWSWINVGPEVRLESWKKDQNQFKGGDGGYFSPTSDVGVGVRGRAISQTGGKTLYKLSGYAGLAARSQATGADTGVVIETEGTGSWLIAPHLIMQAGISFKNSPGYTDTGLKFGLALPFESRSKLNTDDLMPGVVKW